jgi:hypothetical protein
MTVRKITTHTELDKFRAGVGEREAHAAHLRDRPRPTPKDIRTRIADPPSRYDDEGNPLPVGGGPIDPRLKMAVMDEMENLLSSAVTGTPTLATEDQVNRVLASWLQSESLRVADGEPWESIVANAVNDYAFWFQSSPDLAGHYHEPPSDVKAYEQSWKAPDNTLSCFAMDNLPQTHDGTDEYGELLTPWNPSIELDVPAVVSTSRAGHRWPLRGLQTIQTVIDVVEADKWCDLGLGNCTRSSKPSICNVIPFARGDLIVIVHVCRDCWQTWVDETFPEPPEETIYETDVEDDYEDDGG